MYEDTALIQKSHESICTKKRLVIFSIIFLFCAFIITLCIVLIIRSSNYNTPIDVPLNISTNVSIDDQIVSNMPFSDANLTMIFQAEIKNVSLDKRS